MSVFEEDGGARRMGSCRDRMGMGVERREGVGRGRGVVVWGLEADWLNQ